MKKLLITTALLASLSSSVLAAGNEFLVQIKDHKFTPKTTEVPAGEKFTLVIENLDKTLEEFESDDLRREKLVRSGKKVKIKVGALKAGEYKFYGDFHQKTAQGIIVVK